MGYETLSCEARIVALLDKNYNVVDELSTDGFVVRSIRRIR